MCSNLETTECCLKTQRTEAVLKRDIYVEKSNNGNETKEYRDGSDIKNGIFP